MSMATARGRPREPMTARTVRTFFIAAFALSWGAGILFTIFPAPVEALFGPMGYTNPAFILIVYGPGIVAVAMVLRHYGIHGLGWFLRRFRLWRMAWGWWLLLLVGVPVVFYAGAAVNGTVGDGFPFTPWYAVLPALLPALLIGPIEELGWRGVALPLLQRRFAPLWSALILGVVWAVWHTPAFLFMSDTKQSAWAFGPFFLGLVAASVILTAMFNAARGSLLVAFLFHAQLNGPAWPDAQPWDMYLFVVLAAVVVLVDRKTMLTRGAGSTAVLMPADEPAERPRRIDDLVEVERWRSPGARRNRGRTTLLTLEALTGVAALVGGALLVISPAGRLLAADTEVLAGSPFSDWLVPGVLLMLLVGGGFVVTAIAVWIGARRARQLSIVAGVGLVLFELVEFAWIGFHPLQVVFGVVGTAIAVVAIRLPKEPVPASQPEPPGDGSTAADRVPSLARSGR